MPFEITILGSNSAIPAHQRHPSAQVLNIHDKLFLIDCGEATQIRIQQLKIKSGKINHVFISHLHGDHFFGLIGLLTSYHLLKREKPLHLFAHSELMEILNIQLKHSHTTLGYELIFHPIDKEKSKMIFENNEMTVETILMNHRIPCCGFLFKEKNELRKILPEKIQQYKIPVSLINEIKQGKDFIDEKGMIIKNELLTGNPPKSRTYAYCTDTIYNENIIPHIKETDLLYHEATFANDSAKRAELTFHCTAEQAATIAKKAEVKKLIIGHFSAKYEDLNILLNEAKNIFPDTELAEEGKKFTIEKSE